MSKSDGHYKYPGMKLIYSNFNTGEVTIEFQRGDHRHFRITSNYYHLAKRFVELAHEITFKCRDYAMYEWRQYKSLKKITGYQAPDGEE